MTEREIDYYEQLYNNKFVEQDKMYMFLETHKLSTLMQEDMENMNTPTICNETESEVKNFQKEKSKKNPLPRPRIVLSVVCLMKDLSA